MRRKVYHFSRLLPTCTSLTRGTGSIFLLSIAIVLIFVCNSIHAAPKLDTPLKLLINDDELLMQPAELTQGAIYDTQLPAHTPANDPDDRFNLYRSELKRLSYETIHRILRDENEPIYRREDAQYRYHQKRSYPPEHEVVRRAVPMLQQKLTDETTTVLARETPIQHTLKLNNAQLFNFDAARDYEGNRSDVYELDLSNNRLQAVNLSAFTALQQVNLAINELTLIPLNESNNVESTIKILNLNDNRIAHAMTASSANLRELHLSGNEITKLSNLNLSMFSALETLDLSCNHLAELETAFFPQRMHNLKYLNLAYNRIGNIYRETFYNLLSLNTLLLSHNNISDIDYETFLALPNLQYLDLSHNQLRGEAIRALQGIPDLVRLSIAYNPEVGAAMQEFVASWSLKELDASGTGLCQIPAALAQSVRTLKLTDNWLKIINCGDLDSYPLLQYLDLSHSHIEDIEDDALGRLEILETLFLDHNQLHKVPLSLPTSLEHLFLQNNEIMDIHEQSLQGLNNLQTLDLSGNKLLYLPALTLPKLLTLNLRAAGLRGVSQAMVHTLPRLRDLLLDENPIKCSDLLSIAEWASPCRIVERSSISGNGTELESLNIEGNSIIMGEEEEEERQQQQHQHQANDNRIGYGRREIEQIIAMSAAAADKLGQNQPQVQQTDDAALAVEDKQRLITIADATAAEAEAEAAQANNELKQKFVKMHNFFEKFKSNCVARKKQANDKRNTAQKAKTATTPACAVELESSGEQIESKMGAETGVVTFDLPKDNMRTQNEKSNVKTPKTPSNMQQQHMDSEEMSSVGVKDENNGKDVEKAKKEMKNMRAAAQAKLYKFNQKNVAPDIVESSEATKAEIKATKILETKTATPKTRRTTTPASALIKFQAEAASDYTANANVAPVTATTISDALAAATTTIATHAQTQQTRKIQLTNKSTAAPPTTPPTNGPPMEAKTLMQIATVASTETRQPTAVNLLGQHTTTATTTTTNTRPTVNRDENGKQFEQAAVTTEILRTTIKTTEIPITDDMQADAPKTMLVSAAGIDGRDNMRKQQMQRQQTKQKYEFGIKAATKITTEDYVEANAPKSMLVKTMHTDDRGYRRKQQTLEKQQKQLADEYEQKYHFEIKTKTTKIPTIDDVEVNTLKSIHAKTVVAENIANMGNRQMRQEQKKQQKQQNEQKYDFQRKTTTKIPTIDDVEVNTPKSIHANAVVSAYSANMENQQKQQKQQNEQKLDVETKTKTKTTTTTTNSTAKPTTLYRDKLTATSLLNNTKKIHARQEEQENQKSTGNASVMEMTATTKNADVARFLKGTKNVNLAESMLAADNGNYMTADVITEATAATKTIEKTTTVTEFSINTKILPITASFLQMSRDQISTTNSTQATKGTLEIAATKLINKSEIILAPMRARGVRGDQDPDLMAESETLKEIDEGNGAKAITTTTKQNNIETAKTTNSNNLQKTTTTNRQTTRQLPQTTIPSLSLATEQQRKDNNLNGNDSDNDNDGHKVQQNLMANPTRQTQFWHQHNFKRANPYPNDISGQRHQSEESSWEASEVAGGRTKHATNSIEIKTTTQLPPATPPHKHEPLQLHVRDRHLIGTPLLQHRGENVLVEAAEVLRQIITTTTQRTLRATTTKSALRTTINDIILQQSAMSDKGLATGQPTEAGHQIMKGEGQKHESEERMKPQIEITINSRRSNNNSSNTKRPEAESINVETNVTPMQREIGSDVEQQSEADKEILVKQVGAIITTTRETEISSAKTTTDNISIELHKTTTKTNGWSTLNSTEHRAHIKKYAEIAGGSGGVSGGRRKPTLIMKKMTIQTKHATHEQPAHYTLNMPRENEAVLHERAAAAATGRRHFTNANSITDDWETEEADIAEHAELMPPAHTSTTTQHKHSTVNTPIIRRSHERLLAAMHSAHFDENEYNARDVATAQHSISNQQREHAHVQEREPPLQQAELAAAADTTHSQTQKWLGVRKVSASTAHPGLVILISCSLFFVLLIGLLHVYRCDVLPWRRHLLAHQQRPHQLQFNIGATDDDAHSFLHYHNNGGGQQQQQPREHQPPRWHHGERLRAPYSSPLHNLHVRELQKTSAVELETAACVTRSHYDIRPYAKSVASTTTARRYGSTTSNASGGSGSGDVSRNSSSSLSSTCSSSTAGILDVDDNTFYVEMVSECGQMAASEALHSDMLPMELLAVASTCKRNFEKDAPATSVQETTSLRLAGDEKSASSKNNAKARDVKSINTLLSDSRKSKMSASGAAFTTSASSSTRKFDLW